MIAVIGDIHGCYFTFKALMEKISSKYKDISVFCVGDLVDRGNYSYEVVDFFLKNGVKFTPGNHDYMFYDYFRKPGSIFAKTWIYNGNEATLRSYENRIDMINLHLDYIYSQPLYYDLPDCFISHAGISERYKNRLPDNFMEDRSSISDLINDTLTDEDGILWSRERLLNIGKLQLVGHTKQYEVRVDDLANAAYIDTGACAGLNLSCVIVENNSIIEVLSEETRNEDIE